MATETTNPSTDALQGTNTQSTDALQCVSTVFSNERKTYTTVIEGDTLRMAGECTIGDVETHSGASVQHSSASLQFYGQILDKASGEYLGDYSANNISINATGRAGIWSEAAALMEQLQSDIEAKASETQEGGEA